jgi:hypothetical protein
MAELIEIARVVVIADTQLEKILLAEFIKMGAKGYNCSYCTGKGRHESVDDVFNGNKRVRIEVLARPHLAAAILEYMHKKQFGSYPAAAFMDTVEVDSRDTFF